MKQQAIIIDKSFLHWRREDLKKQLNVTQKIGLSALEDWLNKEVSITESEQLYLKGLRERAVRYIEYWNEMELREKLIADVVRLVQFEHYENEINTFAERTLLARTQLGIFDIKLHGIVDWVAATGRQSPEAPFFFIHEYKAIAGKMIDGPAQLLAAMYAAYLINQVPPAPNIQEPNPVHFYKDMPIYGAYVEGRNWFFLALKGNQYDISKGYLFTNEGVPAQILKHLKTQKQMIHGYFKK